MNIDYKEITDEKDGSRRIDLAVEQLRRFSPDNPPPLSDFYTRLDKGGQSFLVALAEQEQNAVRGGQQFKWKIQVRRDEWGNVPGPGDVVVRTMPKNLKDRKSSPTPSGEINAAIIDGSFAERFEDRYEYVVDEKGCITCTFTDAGYFLQNWGVHFRTNRGLSGRPEYSKEPCKAPSGGMLHVHYWRYAEVPAADYATLPPRGADTKKQTRGK